MTDIAIEQIKRPEAIQDIAEAIREGFIEHGAVADDLAATLAVISADIVWERFAGQQIYVGVQTSKTHQEIYEKLCLPHSSFEAVAKEYGYTVRWVRIIYNQMSATENARQQPSLFE